jgi:predicted transposase YbfD/YdcC
MVRIHVPVELARRVRQAARDRCGYCLSPQHLVLGRLQFEHLLPRSRGGQTEEANLWLSCALCNNYKGDRTNFIDPETGATVPLFNPRTQNWPRLLELLDLHGALVTIDAIGCQKEIARAIVAGGGDQVLTVKGNQGHLLADIQATVEQALDGDLPRGVVETCTTTGYAHGRQEERSYVVIHHVEGIRDRAAWPERTTVGMCYSERTVAGKSTTEVRSFIGSRRMGARKYARALRDHWRIENNQHWQLDISFREDASRIRQRHAAENFALLRRLALGLLKQNPTKQSIARKRKGAALDPGFLEEILAGAANVEKV